MVRGLVGVMLLCSACTSERKMEVSLIFSPYCLALHLGNPPEIQANVTRLEDLASISFDLMVLGSEEIEMGRLAPVRGPYCASQQPAEGQPVDVGGLLLDAVSLVADVPVLEDGARYMLMGGMFPNVTGCGGNIEACAVSGEFGEDIEGETVEMWALCPTSAEQPECDEDADCDRYWTGCVQGRCDDIAPVTLAGYRASYEACRMFHTQAMEQAAR